jgi:hypothetical protein
MSYGNILQKLATGGAAPAGVAAPAALGVGVGAPPKMPDLPPPPTMTGAMPTGSPSTDKKAAADQAVTSLRDLKGHYPQLGTMLDATVDAIKAAATGPGGAAPTGPLGAPSAPGTPPPAVPAPAASGSPGAL